MFQGCLLPIRLFRLQLTYFCISTLYYSSSGFAVYMREGRVGCVLCKLLHRTNEQGKCQEYVSIFAFTDFKICECCRISMEH